jgi:hypothetical protein
MTLNRQNIARRVPLEKLKAPLPIQDTYMRTLKNHCPAHEDGFIGATEHSVMFNLVVSYLVQKINKLGEILFLKTCSRKNKNSFPFFAISRAVKIEPLRATNKPIEPRRYATRARARGTQADKDRELMWNIYESRLIHGMLRTIVQER